MDVCSFNDLREHLSEKLDHVHQSRVPLLVTRANAPAVVVIDQDEFDAIMETAHLLRSPTNTERLQHSVTEAETQAETTAWHQLIDP